MMGIKLLSALWISVLILCKCHAITITYIVESPIFCEVNSSKTDTVSKYVSYLLNDTTTRDNQVQLKYDMKTLCSFDNMDKNISNFSDFIVFISENTSTNFSMWPLKPNVPFITTATTESTTIRNSTVISTHYDTETLGNVIYKMLEALRWPYIQVILQPTSYYRAILRTFQRSRDSPYICAVRTLEVNLTSDVKMLLTSLQYEAHTKGILILADDLLLKDIIQVWKASTELEHLHFVALFEDSTTFETSLESIPGWFFIPRSKVQEHRSSIENTDVSLIPNVLLKHLQTATHFIVDTLSIVNNSACNDYKGNDSDECLNSRLLSEMILKEQRNSIYSIQIDHPGNVTNTSLTARIVQVGVINKDEYTTINPMILYDKQNGVLKTTAVSWSEAFHYLCRSHIKFQQLASPVQTDLRIVGSLPLHYSSYTPEGCGELRDNYILMSEALVFAVKYVNNLTNILPNVKLGYDVIDTCSVPARFIHQMDILYSKGLRNVNGNINSYVGGVGFLFSSEIESLAHYSYAKQIPTMSISATSSAFSNKELYPYFMRMVPSNKEEALAIIGVLEYLSIHSIGIVYTNDAFGSDIARSVLTFAEEKGIKATYILRMEDAYVENAEIVNYLVDTYIVGNNDDVEAVVSLTQSSHTKALLQRLTDLNFTKVFWIGCDTWIAGIEESFLKRNIEVASNAILIAFESKIPEKFLKYIRKKTSLHEENIYVRQLIEKENDCTFGDKFEKTQCNDIVDFHNLFQNVAPHGETHVIDAVISLAYGVDALIRNHCPLLDFCNEANENLEKLAEIIQKMRINDIEDKQIYFDSKGDGKEIFHIMQTDAVDTHKHVGIWLQGRTIMDNDTLQIPQLLFKNNLQPCSGTNCYSIPTDITEMKHTFLEGDVMIYAFLELYEKNGETCSESLILDTFEVATSALWSIQNINRKQPRNYPKIGLGIFAMCGHDSTVAKSVVKPSFVVPKLPSSPFIKPILGLVGAITNPVASAMYDARNSVSIDFPMIISATTERFNDRERNPRVFRTVMSSTFDVYIVIELAKRIGWTYFHAIFGDRDQSLVDLMEQETSALNMCMATKHTIKMSDLENELSKAVEKMLQYDGATVVMVFIPIPAIEVLLKVADEKNTFGKLVFIIPKYVENIDNIVSKYSKPSLGLVVLQNNMTENKQFKSYYQSLNIEDGDWSKQLPWGERFWEDVHKCNLRFSNRYSKDCTTNLVLSTLKMKQSPFVVSTMNGIYALSTAFHKYLTKHCGTSDFVSCVNSYSSKMYEQLEYELDHVSVVPDGGNLFSFDNRNATVPMAILNFQYGPNGNPRLVTVGSIRKVEITLDLRKLSMYNLRGERRIFRSECPDNQCVACVDPAFVSAYQEKVNLLSSLPPVTVNSFHSGVGLTTIFLLIIGLGLAAVCTYYLAKHSSHKIFSLSADGHACIIIGTTIQILGAAVYLFDGSPMACGIHLALPGSVYSITLTGLLIKLNKTACLHAIVGTNITKLPKWDFAFTYLPIIISAPIIVFVVWNQGDPVGMTWSVPTLFQISKIDDISITWQCSYNRTEYILFMTFFWIILFLCMMLSIIYKCKKTGRKEVKQVLFSAICYSFFSVVTTIVRLLSDDHVVFRAFMSITLPLNGVIILIVNFLPQIIDLMREKNRELLFSRLVSDHKTSHIASIWKDIIQDDSVGRAKTKEKHKRKNNEKVSLSMVGLSTKWRRKTQKATTSEA